MEGGGASIWATPTSGYEIGRREDGEEKGDSVEYEERGKDGENSAQREGRQNNISHRRLTARKQPAGSFLQDRQFLGLLIFMKFPGKNSSSMIWKFNFYDSWK